MLKIAICDDEKDYLELISLRLEKLIREHIGIEIEILCFSDIETLYERLTNDGADIVFLDVMVNGINALNWLTEHQEKFSDTAFIIMTGYPTETENLSEIECCYFLLKSKMTDEHLLNAIKRSITALSKSGSLSVGKRSFTVDWNSVAYIESVKNNQRLIFADGSTLTVYSTMKTLFEKLPPCFYQCHKSFAVNLDFVSGFEPHCFIISNGTKIPIPLKKYKSATAYYEKYANSL